MRNSSQTSLIPNSSFPGTYKEECSEVKGQTWHKMLHDVTLLQNQAGWCMTMISEKAEGVPQIPGQSELYSEMRPPPPKKVLAEANKVSFGSKVTEQLNRKPLLSRKFEKQNICFSKSKGRRYRQ